MDNYLIHPSFRFTQRTQNLYVARDQQLKIPLVGGSTLYSLVLGILQPDRLHDKSLRWLIGFGRIQNEDGSAQEDSLYKIAVTFDEPKSVFPSIENTGSVHKISWSDWEVILALFNPFVDTSRMRLPVWRDEVPVNDPLPPGITRKWLNGTIERLITHAMHQIDQHNGSFADFEDFLVRRRTGKMPEVELRSVIAFADFHGYKGFGRVTSSALRKIKLYVNLLDKDDFVDIYH